MPNAHRLEQINSNIHRELSSLFTRELEFPADCIVSISRVKTSEDLHWAQIWVSILPMTKRTKIRKMLDKNRGLLQHHLNKRMRMKPIPRLQFFTDFTEEQAEGIEATIDKAMKEL